MKRIVGLVLGIVLLSVGVMWAAGGSEGTEPGYSISNAGFDSKGHGWLFGDITVTDWVDTLVTLEACTTALRDFHDYTVCTVCKTVTKGGFVNASTDTNMVTLYAQISMDASNWFTFDSLPHSALGDSAYKCKKLTPVPGKYLRIIVQKTYGTGDTCGVSELHYFFQQ